MTRLVLVRVASLPFDALSPLAGEASAIAAREAIRAEVELDAVASALERRLFEQAGPRASVMDPGEARRRHRLLALRRRVHGLSELSAEEDAPYAAAHAGLGSARARFTTTFGAELARTRAALLDLAGRPPLRLAIRLASASLSRSAERLRRKDGSRWDHGDRHRAGKLAAYAGRAATKTSPNGLFCATALAGVGETLAIDGSPAVDRLDALFSVAEARKSAALFAADPALAEVIAPRVEPTLHRDADSWTFWRAATFRDSDDEEVRSRIRCDDAVDAAIGLADGTRSLSALVAQLARMLEVDAGEAHHFVAGLVRAGAIVAEVGIPYAERRPLAWVLATARRAGIEPAWGGAVDAAESCVDAVTAAGAGADPALVDAAVAALGALPRVRPLAEDDVVRVDAAAALRLRVPASWIDEVRRGLRPYARLFAAMYPERRHREATAAKFLSRFPADVDVGALDLYHGVFEGGDGERPASFPEGGAGPSVARRVRERLAEAALADPLGTLQLDDAWVDEIAGSPEEPRWACGVLFQAAARGAAFVLSSLYEGSGLALARFAQLHGPAVVDELRRCYSILERPGAVLAEITYNHGGRTANAGLRPSLFEHEILLPGETPSPGRTVIPLRELVVRWDGAAERFVAHWPRGKVEVVPVINSGVNPTGVVAFLVGVGRRGFQPLALFPGFEDPRVRRWPRVATGRLVLFRARWVLPPASWPDPSATTAAAFFLEVQRWRDREALPRFVFVATPADPKPRALDLEAPVFVDLLRRTLAPARGNAPASLHVTEMLPGPGDLWIEGPDGGYASEFLVQLEHPGGGA